MDVEEITQKTRHIMQHLYGKAAISDAYNSVMVEQDYLQLRDTFGLHYINDEDVITVKNDYHTNGLKPVLPENISTSIFKEDIPEGLEPYRLLASLHISKMETL